MRKIITTKMIILSTLVLSSCSLPTIEPQVRKIFSAKFMECRCQYYDYNSLKAQDDPILCEDFYAKYFPDEPQKQNLDYCEALIGHTPETWAVVKVWIFRLIETIKDMLD